MCTSAYSFLFTLHYYVLYILLINHYRGHSCRRVSLFDLIDINHSTLVFIHSSLLMMKLCLTCCFLEQRSNSDPVLLVLLLNPIRPFCHKPPGVAMFAALKLQTFQRSDKKKSPELLFSLCFMKPTPNQNQKFLQREVLQNRS